MDITSISGTSSLTHRPLQSLALGALLAASPVCLAETSNPVEGAISPAQDTTQTASESDAAPVHAGLSGAVLSSSDSVDGLLAKDNAAPRSVRLDGQWRDLVAAWRARAAAKQASALAGKIWETFTKPALHNDGDVNDNAALERENRIAAIRRMYRPDPQIRHRASEDDDDSSAVQAILDLTRQISDIKAQAYVAPATSAIDEHEFLARIGGDEPTSGGTLTLSNGSVSTGSVSVYGGTLSTGAVVISRPSGSFYGLPASTTPLIASGNVTILSQYPTALPSPSINYGPTVPFNPSSSAIIKQSGGTLVLNNPAPITNGATLSLSGNTAPLTTTGGTLLVRGGTTPIITNTQAVYGGTLTLSTPSTAGSNTSQQSAITLQSAAPVQLTLAAVPASLINGDFETGDFTGWTRAAFSTQSLPHNSTNHTYQNYILNQNAGTIATDTNAVVTQQTNPFFIDPSTPINPTHGTHLAFISNETSGAALAGSSISQTFTVPAGALALSFDVQFLSEEGLDSGWDFGGVALLQGSTLLAQFNLDQDPDLAGTGADAHASGTPSGGFEDSTGWIHHSFSLSAYQGQTVTLIAYITNTGDTSAESRLLLDNVAIPEPAGLPLLGSAAALLLGLGRLRRRARVA